MVQMARQDGLQTSFADWFECFRNWSGRIRDYEVFNNYEFPKHIAPKISHC